MIQPNSSSPVKIVFTIASQGTLLERAQKNQPIPVHSLDTLKSQNRSWFDSSFLVISVGTRTAASEEAALWIRKNFDNLIVVHIGEAVSASDRGTCEKWFMPSQAIDENGRTIPLDTRLPFPWPSSLPLMKGGSVLSLAHQEPTATPPPAEIICTDTETFPLARVYAHSNISFHVMKMLRSPASRLTGFATSDALRPVLDFLTGPGEPAISAIVPVYNRATRIVPCVESILSQSLPPKEVIVVDDGSTDGTAEALKPLQSKIEIVTLKGNRGVSTARNIGVESAGGTWISFLDSDDLWHRDKLLGQWQFLNKNPFYDIVQSEEIWIRNGTRVNPCNHHQKPEGWIWLPSLSLCLVSPSSVMMKKDLFQAYGGFDPSLPACEDYDLWLRISRDRPVGLDPSLSVIKHGGHDDQLSKQYPAMDRFRVKALFKALDQETDGYYENHLRAVLKKKLTILASGCKKRQKLDQARYFESLLHKVDTPHRA
jgi:GT2 family glycosyltransferase